MAPAGRRRAAPSKGSTSRKKIKTGATLKRPATLKQEDASGDDRSAVVESERQTESLKDRFIKLFSDPKFASGISNSVLKAHFGPSKYTELAPIINDLVKESRLDMSKATGSNELFYSLLTDEVAAKFQGLDATARMVFQTIEKSGNLGCWTKGTAL